LFVYSGRSMKKVNGLAGNHKARHPWAIVPVSRRISMLSIAQKVTIEPVARL
jgi:hypothetical protein